MGHEYYDKDEVFNSYITEMAKDYADDVIEEIDASSLGPDVLSAVERVNQQVQAA